MKASETAEYKIGTGAHNPQGAIDSQPLDLDVIQVPPLHGFLDQKVRQETDMLATL
jgi:hypothetical protein